MCPISKPSSVLLVILLGATLVNCEIITLTIPLNNTFTVSNRELYGAFHELPKNSSLQVNLMNFNKNLNFTIFQVHSHLYNVTLYKNQYVHGTHIEGTNIGLYGNLSSSDVYYVLNTNTVDLKLYISVHGYTDKDPIAGGCNMVAPVPISPFMYVQYTNDLVFVDAQPARNQSDVECIAANHVKVVFYRMYLHERDFTEDHYFEGLRKMMTLDKIRENGDEVPQTIDKKAYRRYLGAYPGVGSVYVAVASMSVNSSRYSIYVPTHTYACSPLDGCQTLDDTVSQLMAAALIFIGVFICSLGHRFFKTEMFTVGMFAGILVTYIALSSWTDLDRPALLGASFLTGLFSGSIWALLWWFYGIPVLSVALTTMHFGFIVAAIIYHCVPDGNALFMDNTAFWSIFISLMLCTCMTLTTISYISNIACCAILGAYAVIFSIDHYVGSSLKYLIINTIRRAVVEDFRHVNLALPYQWADAIMTVAWLALSIGGFLFQHYHNRNRMPFPCPPRSIRPLPPTNASYGTTDNGFRRFFDSSFRVDRATSVSERTPLLQDA